MEIQIDFKGAFLIFRYPDMEMQINLIGVWSVEMEECLNTS